MEKTKIVDEIIINPEKMDGSSVKKVSDADYQRISGTYLHGILQTQNGYDIFNIIGIVPNCTGKFPARILGRPVSSNQATFFLWQTRTGENVLYHGLVPLNTDKESLKDAEKKFEERRSFI